MNLHKWSLLFFCIIFGIEVNASGFNDLSEDQKQVALSNYAKYKDLSAEKKQKLEENYQHYQSYSPGQKQKMDQRFNQLKNLSADRKKWALARGNSRNLKKSFRSNNIKSKHRGSKRTGKTKRAGELTLVSNV